MKTVFTALLLVLLTACSSQPVPEIRYYLLNDGSHDRTPAAPGRLTVIGITPLKVAEYLDTDALILQTAPHQLALARFHRWAELPELAIAEALQNDLGELLPQTRIDTSYGGELEDWAYRLHLQVNKFHGDAHGHALLSGHWRLERVADSRVIGAAPFQQRVALQQDGYHALVTALRATVRQLARELAARIDPGLASRS